MKRKILIAVSGIMVVGVFSIVCWACLPKMTVCLTFDDDQNAHATIAGPVLEEHGWRGAFNIVTGRLEHPRAKGKMTWAQAKRLLDNGHEIYPHSYFPDPESPTFSHYNLRKLSESGNIAEVERQIKGARQMIIDHLGVEPKVFCLPYNSINKEVESVIRENGMVPMNCDRRNFPTHPGLTPMSITTYLNLEYRSGRPHVDLMFHGIVREEGGWEPFEDEAHFIRFCDELKQVENQGIVKIVSYGEAHNMADETFLHKVKRKVRRLFFRGLANAGII